MPRVHGLVHLAPFRNAYLIRGAVTWGGIRLFLAFLAFQGAGVPLDLPLHMEVGVLAIVPVAVLLDAGRRSEDLFLANLAVSAVPIVAWSLPLAVVLEWVVP